ncbi:MAG: biosynthetic-type acetolactate synthase large subunit [Planctomycetota bacterium]
MKTGAQLLIDTLIEEGVEIVFGFPGGSVIPIFDVLYDTKAIRLILTRHEQGAVHAADGYARATGKVGVCLSTSGPGATNMVTGIATANMDSIPVVMISGQVKSTLIGNDAFQESDVTGIMRPITKYTMLVKDVNKLQESVKKAFHIARTGRPGPVVLDLPVDVTQAKTKEKKGIVVDIPGYKPNFEGNVNQIKKAADMINKAERPILYVGGGVISSSASAVLLETAEKANIPVTTTLMGLGAFPETHALALKMLGMHGTGYANHAIMESDVIIAVGARFDDRVTGRLDSFAPNAKVIHIDIDPTSLSKNVEVDIPVVGDARLVLVEMVKYLEYRERQPWIKQIAEWKTQFPLTYKRDGAGLKPQFVVEKIWEVSKGEALITTEVGQNQMWAAQFYKFTKPRTFISSGGLGTMGYGLPAAIGVQLAFPDAVVVDIAGDGSIQMNIQELNTAQRLGLPINIVILNNGYLGMVRQWQELFYNKRYSSTDLSDNPDFVKLAEAYGCEGIRVTKPAEVEPALKAAFKSRKVCVIDCIVDREENVFPMVPAGEALNRMIGGMA